MSKRICVVGAGRWGKNHVATLDKLGCLAGVVEADESTRSQLARSYPKAKLFKQVSEALTEGFDGFIVATPADTHFEIAKFILSAGKPVLVEKPLALNAKDARELKRLADEKGVNLMVGHVLLFHPAIRKIKEMAAAGKIGKLEYLYSNRLNLGTVRTEENILWSFAPHDISIFQFLIGGSPEEVVSRGGAFLQPHIHDTTMTILRYPNNIVGHIFVSWLHPFKEHRLVVIGTKGMLVFEDSSQGKDILFYEKGVDFVAGEPIPRDGPTESIPYDRKMPLTEELQYFVERISSGKVEIADGRNGVEVLEVLEKATASLRGEPSDQSRDRQGAPSNAQIAAARSANGNKSSDSTDYYVHPSSYVDDNVEIGEGTKIWHYSHVQSGSRIGKKVSIGQNVNVGNNVRIGNGVKIQNNVSVYEGVELEDFVFCGPSMVFTNIMDPRSKYPQRGKEFYRKTLVREGASIGANATIVCGHTVGRHAFIAAGAVVTKDVPDYAMMVGVPARQMGWVCECGEKLPKTKAEISCPRCKLGYSLKGDILSAK